MIDSVRGAARWISRLQPFSLRSDLVLAYHLIGADTDSPIDLPVNEFRSHLEFIGKVADVVPLSELIRAPGAGSGPRVALTFDDAYANFHSTVLPMLRDAGFAATLYVPVGFIAGDSPSPIRDLTLPPMTWRQLRDAADGGDIEIGSHTYSHPDVRGLPDAEYAHEFEQSREELEQQCGVAVRSFCYPGAFWSRDAERRVRRTYDNAVIAGGARVVATTPTYRVPRLPVRRRPSLAVRDVTHVPRCLDEVLADWARSRRAAARPKS